MSGQSYRSLARVLCGSVAVALASAESGNYRYEEAFGSPFPTGDNYTTELVRNANRNPNATNTLNFTRPSGVEDVSVNTEWFWRVNVTDFSAPNAEPLVQNSHDLDFTRTTFVDPHVVNTVWEFGWSGDGTNVTEALNHTSDPLCITAAAIFGTPPNVTNLYTEDDTNAMSGCVAPLGNDCIRALESSTRKWTVESGCQTAPDWFGLPECASSLGYAFSQTPRHNAITYPFDGNSNSSRLLSPDGFYGVMQGAHNGTNTTAYEIAATQLQIMLITRLYHEEGQSPQSQLLCMRANTSHVEDSSADGQDEDEPGAGSSVGVSSGLVLLTATAWVWVAFAFYL